MKKFIAKLVSVTPDYAATLLEKNTTNRNISHITVKRYAQAMASGEWMQNGQTITIAEDGTILDGQHRLWAVIESGITITFLICASMLGAALPETLPVKSPRKPMVRLSDRRIGERPQNTVSGKMKLSDIRRSKNG